MQWSHIFWTGSLGLKDECSHSEALAQAAPDLQTWASVPEGSRAEAFTGQIPETLWRLKLWQTPREAAHSQPDQRVLALSRLMMSSEGSDAGLFGVNREAAGWASAQEEHSSPPESNKTLLKSGFETLDAAVFKEKHALFYLCVTFLIKQVSVFY